MKKKKYIIFLVVFGLFFSFMVFIVKEKRKLLIDSEERTVKWLTAWLKSYTEENDGRFPKSEQELIEKGYLKKTQLDRGTFYEIYVTDIRFEPNRKIWLPEDLDRYDIRYSTIIDNLYEKEGKIYDKISGKQILLIKGIFMEELKYIYEEASLELYQEMLRWQKKPNRKDIKE